MIVKACKVLTSDLRSPVRSGDPLWDGVLPHTLPPVVLDRGPGQCPEGATGWYACADLFVALRIAGLWPNGRPSRAFHVETDDAVCIARGNKLRAETWTLITECNHQEIEDAIRVMSKPFGTLSDAMVRSQLAWRDALARPLHDATVVERELRAALHCRGLDAWQVRRFQDARAARAAWDAWDARAAWDAWDAWAAWDARAAWDAWAARDARDARAARAAWDAWAARDARAARAARAAWAAWAARDAWDAWVARAAWAARDAWDAWDARAARATWDAWDARAAWDAWDARAARAAWDALTVEFAARSKWISHDPDFLNLGLREAYRNGLEIAVPTGPNELGWAMAEQ